MGQFTPQWKVKVTNKRDHETYCCESQCRKLLKRRGPVYVRHALNPVDDKNRCNMALRYDYCPDCFNRLFTPEGKLR